MKGTNQELEIEQIADVINRIQKAIISCTGKEDWKQDGDKMLIKESGLEKVAKLFNISYGITQSNGRYHGSFTIGNSDSSIEVEAPTRIEVVTKGLERILLGFKLLTPLQVYREYSTTR